MTDPEEEFISMSEITRFRKGKMVRHQIDGYIGVYDGETYIQGLFEFETDTVGCRVRILLNPDGSIPPPDAIPRIASPKNLDLLDDYPIEDRHKYNVTYFGLEYVGSGPSSGKYRRIANCWFCKNRLDSLVDLQCFKCRWILCQCGACGCGFKVARGD